MSGSEGHGGDLNDWENVDFEEDKSEGGNEEEETKDLGDLLAVQMITMESFVNSLELFALKIPSNEKLKRATQKFRAVLEEYKTDGNSESVSAPPPPPPTSAPSTISNARKRRDVKVDQDEEEQEKPPKIQQLDAESSMAETGTGTEAEAAENSGNGSKSSVAINCDSDFIQIPWNYHYDLETKPEEEKIVVFDELKQYFSQFGEISNILIRNQLDLKIFTDLQILGEKVNRVKINLTTLESSSYAFVLDEILTKCPNLTFLDIEQKGEEQKDLDGKALFGLFLMKAVNQRQSKHQGQGHGKGQGKGQGHGQGKGHGKGHGKGQGQGQGHGQGHGKGQGDDHHEPLPLNFTISELRVDFGLYGDSKAPVYKAFAESGVQVKNLSISHNLLIKYCPEVTQATTDIFRSSQNEMAQFSYQTIFSNVWNRMKIPVMPSLHSLFISARVDDDIALFHPDFEFSKHAPNLKTLTLNLKGGELLEKLWASTVPGQSLGLGQGQGQSAGPGPGPALSVKTLHFSDSGRLYDVEILLKLFTQLEELSLPWRRYSNTSSVFKICKKLKKLTLFDLKLDSKENYMSVLAQLTGFRVEDVEKLWNQNENSKEPIEVDSKQLKQIGPSITALQDLETLTLEPKCSWDARTFRSEFLSLFQKLTSDAMPKLEEIYL